MRPFALWFALLAFLVATVVACVSFSCLQCGGCLSKIQLSYTTLLLHLLSIYWVIISWEKVRSRASIWDPGSRLIIRHYSQEDHEIFDIVTELEAAEGKGTTFYSWLDVSSTATTNEIAKAYRKKSMILQCASVSFLICGNVTQVLYTLALTKTRTSRAYMSVLRVLVLFRLF